MLNASWSGGSIPHALGKSFQTSSPNSSHAAKNSSRLLHATQLRIIVKFMSRCIRTAASIRSAGIRRSSSSQPQFPPRHSTLTPFTLIFSGSGARSTDFTSVHAEPSSETWITYVFGYACSHRIATWSKLCFVPRSTWIHWLSA